MVGIWSCIVGSGMVIATGGRRAALGLGMLQTPKQETSPGLSATAEEPCGTKRPPHWWLRRGRLLDLGCAIQASRVERA